MLKMGSKTKHIGIAYVSNTFITSDNAILYIQYITQG